MLLLPQLCECQQQTPDFKQRVMENGYVFNLGLIGVQAELAHGQRVDAKWLSVLGTRTWAEVSGPG